MIVFIPLLAISSIAKFHMNFNFNIIVLHMVLSSILIIVSPDISSMNGASTFINFHSLGFSTIHSFRKTGRDLFKKLKQQSHEFMTPPNSKIFLKPTTKSTLSWISDTKVYISNLYPCISIIIGIINKTLKIVHFPLEFFVFLMQIWKENEVIYSINSVTWT